MQISPLRLAFVMLVFNPRMTRSLLIGFILLTRPLLASTEWRTFTDQRDRKIIAKVISVGDDFAMLELKANGRQTAVSFDMLCEADVDYLTSLDLDATTPGSTDESASEEPEDIAANRLYPRSKQESATASASSKRLPCPLGYRAMSMPPSNLSTSTAFSAAFLLMS